MKTPVIIVTGYLGSGKTTMLRNIIDRSQKKIAILMNEFGEIGIDSQILKGKNMDMIELSGGCVCCSLTGEFEYAIKEILEKIKPEMIVVETTGVAEPDAIALDISDNIPGVHLDLVVTIVDADSIVRFPSIGHTGRMQIEMADTMLLNKIDLVDENKKAEVYDKIKQINDRAEIFETIRCEIDIEMLFGIEQKEKEFKNITHNHIENEGIEYFSYETACTMNMEKFNEFLTRLPRNIFRSKGFVLFPEGSFLLNFVFGRWDIEEAEAEKTQLVFIGKKILNEKEKIIKDLKECEMR